VVQFQKLARRASMTGGTHVSALSAISLQHRLSHMNRDVTMASPLPNAMRQATGAESFLL